ncbi:hypothetical protein K432DRAFT_422644 [Lepidopterella palustris CBS 459.81]|uniref:Histidine kinase n=1 Tax=Lepidopterella palustris CBS 459.81 TaxID=1314670 RepID=A0A8E2JJG8_9PEZI|nr:hypothetical protein K432DRAFT_422644 [Lepidopterella palustris CBS 459.81]
MQEEASALDDCVRIVWDTTGKSIVEDDLFKNQTNTEEASTTNHGQLGGPVSFYLPSLRSFNEVSITEFLDLDERPTFVIDLELPADRELSADHLAASTTKSLDVIYQNPAMRSIDGLLDIVLGYKSASDHGQPMPTTYTEFRAWALTPLERGVSVKQRLSSLPYNGINWNASTLRNRWNIINGIFKKTSTLLSNVNSNCQLVSMGTSSFTAGDFPLLQLAEEPSKQQDRPLSLCDRTELLHQQQSAKLEDPVHDIPVPDSNSSQTGLAQSHKYDWTVLASDPPLHTSPYIHFIRKFDWASTPVGPIETWSSHLRLMCLFTMAHPVASVLFWGPRMTMIYNEAALPLIGSKHPHILGKPPTESFFETKVEFLPVLSRCIETGHGAHIENMLLFLDRGYSLAEESYFSVSFTPLIGDSDTIVGWWGAVAENTKQRLAERRMSTLVKLGESTASCPTLKAFWGQILQALKSNSHDIIFALLYSSTDEIELHEMPPVDGCVPPKRFGFEGALGIPLSHPSVVSLTDIDTSHSQGFIPYFQTAASLVDPLLLQVKDGTLPKHLVVGIESSEFHDPCDAVVVCAIRPTTTSIGPRRAALGFIVIGLNTRRPYDDEYRSFILLLSRQITTSMPSVLLLEQETRRRRAIAEQASIDQQFMEDELAIRTNELEKSTFQLRGISDSLLVGIFVADYLPGEPNGSYSYRNDKWFELTGDSPANLAAWKYPLWTNLHPDDAVVVRDAWDSLTIEAKSEAKFEFRVTNRPKLDDISINYAWLLCFCHAYRHDDGSIRSVVGSCTDITSQKMSEDLQKKRMEDALEAQRQQENFIDVTSHEIRNPLGAIIISADNIIRTLQILRRELGNPVAKSASLLEEMMDSAETILNCAQHQKRIVDDILTMSKLDSGLYNIVPVDIQLVDVLNNMLKIFDGELSMHDMKTFLVEEHPLLALNVKNVLVDPTRVLQILINLVTNAIKFTRKSAKRVITVRVSASPQRPDRSYEGIQYLPVEKPKEDLTRRLEWGDGEVIYLLFAVQDTGCGLTDDEKKLLFKRFSSPPRTYISYGGSGLGLFICRELTEMQGGQIGVKSTKNVGSTFVFYIKARRSTTAPAECEWPASPSLAPQTYLACSPATSCSKSLITSMARSPPTTTQAARTAQAALTAQEALTAQVALATQTALASQTALTAQSALTTQAALTAQAALKAQAALRALLAFEAETLAEAKFDILLVEDNKINQKVFSKQLLKLGHRVVIANHGVEAIDHLRKTTFWKENQKHGTNLTVMLMDIEMPVMDGLTCVRQIRELQRQGMIVRYVPIIAITANARVEQIQIALDAGMDDVVSKPFRVPDLVMRIERLNGFSPQFEREMGGDCLE